MNISIGNPGLDHFDSDGGVKLDFGLPDSNGQPIGNLKPDNVKVFEDGKQAKIIDFRGVGQGRPVDIVFVMDVTQSMQPYIDAIKKNFEVVSPPIYLTGYLEFQDALGKNLSEAYVGQLPAKDVLKKTEAEWNKIIGRIGRSKLKKDLASYKAVMPTRNVPA